MSKNKQSDNQHTILSAEISIRDVFGKFLFQDRMFVYVTYITYMGVDLGPVCIDRKHVSRMGSYEMLMIGIICYASEAEQRGSWVSEFAHT